MQRLHLVELEDLPWVPDVIRDAGRDLLDLGFDRMGFYRACVPHLVDLMQKTGVHSVVDLASGGGGGVMSMRKELRTLGHTDTRFLLTDRFPNAGAAQRVHGLNDSNVRYHLEPVDALSSEKRPEGIRTMFGALHHFQPADVQRILGAAVKERAPLAIFDVGANEKLRRIPAVMAPVAAVPNLLMLFVVTLLMVPVLRPFQLSRLLLTYIVPLIPILVAWDGTVSAMRAYSAEELLQVARTVPGGDAYEWKAGAEGMAVYLTGTPR